MTAVMARRMSSEVVGVRSWRKELESDDRMVASMAVRSRQRGRVVHLDNIGHTFKVPSLHPNQLFFYILAHSDDSFPGHVLLQQVLFHAFHGFV